jgi:hypothetical protein
MVVSRYELTPSIGGASDRAVVAAMGQASSRIRTSSQLGVPSPDGREHDPLADLPIPRFICRAYYRPSVADANVLVDESDRG